MIDFSVNRGTGNGGILYVFPAFEAARLRTIYSELPKVSLERGANY